MVDFRVFGAPRFSVQRSQNTYFKGFWGLWTENRGAPQNAKINHDGSNPPVSALWQLFVSKWVAFEKWGSFGMGRSHGLLKDIERTFGQKVHVCTLFPSCTVIFVYTKILLLECRGLFARIGPESRQRTCEWIRPNLFAICANRANHREEYNYPWEGGGGAEGRPRGQNKHYTPEIGSKTIPIAPKKRFQKQVK